MSEWISTKERLPDADDCERDLKWVTVIVSVLSINNVWRLGDRFVSEPYDREFVTTADFDTEQKIWHVCETNLNALIPIEDAPTSNYSMYITHWMPLPEPPR